MKRFLISLCVVALCFTMVGCGEASIPSNFSVGTVNGQVYENSYIGIGCKLPEDFTYTSSEGLDDINDIEYEADEAERNAIYNDAATIYLMQANNLEGGGVGINLENTKAEGATVTSAKGYLTTAKTELPAAMTSMGFTNVTVDEKTFDFAGGQYTGLQVSGNIYEEKFFQNYICYEVDKFLVVVSFGAYGEGTVDSLTEAFYAV